jgi:hypothetical protein
MRDVNTLKGLHGLRTMLSTKKRSIPRVQSSTYLDLYMLGKEKERLLKESERLGLRDTVIEKRLKEIDSEANKLQKTESITESSADPQYVESISTQRNGAKKEWKKMPLLY